VDTTGLIFVVVVVAWLVYLVPQHLAKKAPLTSADDALGASPEPTVTLHKGVPKPPDPLPDETTEDLLEGLFDLPVSTDLTRRAQRHALARMARRSARIRRNTLIAGLLVAVLAVTLFGLGVTSWVTPAVACGALVVGVLLARWNVVRVNRRLERLRRAIDLGQEETTVAIRIVRRPIEDREERMAVIVPPEPASLWDPLPVPPSTYVSKPLAPRTVRTIDLATPLPSQPFPVVTAEGWNDETQEISQAM
jgi:HAMP domain-containing protein